MTRKEIDLLLSVAGLKIVEDKIASYWAYIVPMDYHPVREIGKDYFDIPYGAFVALGNDNYSMEGAVLNAYEKWLLGKRI